MRHTTTGDLCLSRLSFEEEAAEVRRDKTEETCLSLEDGTEVAEVRWNMIEVIDSKRGTERPERMRLNEMKVYTNAFEESRYLR